MSGIIKKILKHKKTVVVLCLSGILIAGFLMFRLYIPAILLAAVIMVNELTFRKMNRQKEPFSPGSRVRNVGCLVIGDISPKDAAALAGERTAVSICLPGCTLAGAYEVLRHTFSILKEDGGKAVLVVKGKNLKKSCCSLFDEVFFHPVTVNRLGLKKVRAMGRFPAVFAPVRSLVFCFGTCKVCTLLSERPAAGDRKEYYDGEIIRFGSERGIEIRILEA